MSDFLWPHESQHTRPPCPSPTPGVHPSSRPSSQWCHPAISSSVVPFSFCPQSLPASKSFPMSQLFTWGVKVFLIEKNDLNYIWKCIRFSFIKWIKKFCHSALKTSPRWGRGHWFTCFLRLGGCLSYVPHVWSFELFWEFELSLNFCLYYSFSNTLNWFAIQWSVPYMQIVLRFQKKFHILSDWGKKKVLILKTL